MRDHYSLSRQDVPDGAFYKSSYSGGGSGSECLEVAPLAGGVRVRDSKRPHGPVLNIFAADFQAFLTMVKNHGTPLAG